MNIAIIGFDGMQSIDFTGPLEVFFKANTFADGTPYTIYKLGLSEKHITTGSGMGVWFDKTLASCDVAFDTLIIPGGTSCAIDLACEDPFLLDWLRKNHCRRIVSVCTGAFVLGAAGLLEGRRATTHWESTSRFRERFPNTHVDDDALYVKAGNIYTSAGITAGIDLALRLVEDDLGRNVALKVAQELVIHLKRPANQAQLSSVLQTQFVAQGKIGDVLAWMASEPAADLSVDRLADRAAMSTRNFSRHFKLETGTTPAKFVEALRLQHAKTLLQETDLPLKQIVSLSGFGSEETLRRLFKQQLGISPGRFRSHHRIPTEQA